MNDATCSLSQDCAEIKERSKLKEYLETSHGDLVK
jgi:hypothetical protein